MTQYYDNQMSKMKTMIDKDPEVKKILQNMAKSYSPDLKKERSRMNQRLTPLLKYISDLKTFLTGNIEQFETENNKQKAQILISKLDKNLTKVNNMINKVEEKYCILVNDDLDKIYDETRMFEDAICKYLNIDKICHDIDYPYFDYLFE